MKSDVVGNLALIVELSGNEANCFWIYSKWISFWSIRIPNINEIPYQNVHFNTQSYSSYRNPT